MKRAMAKQELLTILDCWSESLEQMNEFGVIVFKTTEHQMSASDLFDGRFDYFEYICSKRHDKNYPYEAKVDVAEYTFFAILTEEQFKKYFDEVDGEYYRRDE